MYALFDRAGRACYTPQGPTSASTFGEAVMIAYRAGVRALWLTDPDDWRRAVEVARQQGYYLVTQGKLGQGLVYAIGARPTGGGRELMIFGPPALAAWGFPRASTWIDIQSGLLTINEHFDVRIGDGLYTPMALAIELVKRYVNPEHLVPHASESERARDWQRATHDLAFFAAPDAVDASEQLVIVDRRSAYLTVASDTRCGIGPMTAPDAPDASGHYLATIEVHSRRPGPDLLASEHLATGEYIRAAIMSGWDVTVRGPQGFGQQAGVFRTWGEHLWLARERFRGTIVERAVKSLALMGLGWACRDRKALWARIVNENARRLVADARKVLPPARWIGAYNDSLCFLAPDVSAVAPLLRRPGRGGYKVVTCRPAPAALAALTATSPQKMFDELKQMTPLEVPDAAAV